MPRVIWQGRVVVGSRDAIANEAWECRIVDGVKTKDVTMLAHHPAPVCGLTVERLGKDACSGGFSEGGCR